MNQSSRSIIGQSTHLLVISDLERHQTLGVAVLDEVTSLVASISRRNEGPKAKSVNGEIGPSKEVAAPIAGESG